ncbi:hypothetical protein ES703_74512 [subsurface metagenome]
MTTYIDSLPGNQGSCQVPQSKLAQSQSTRYTGGEPGPLLRAKRTPGAVAVSGVYGRELAGGKIPASIPWTNSVPGGSWSGPAGDLFGVILECIAKRSAKLNHPFERDCPSGFITGSCENGHRFAKELYCGREWCEVCNGTWKRGEQMKPSHARRFARWYSKAQQIDSMGYFTFTIPEALRAKYRTKVSLARLGHQVQEILKSRGFKRGLRRWHYFGEQGGTYHPHLNCLVDGRFMEKRELRELRREYSKLLGVKLAIADYHYFEKPGEKVHAVTYVTRATFLDWRWDPDLAGELRGFRNQVPWGYRLWSGEPVWSLADLGEEAPSDMSDEDTLAVASLERGECPRCGLPILWERWLPISMLPELGGSRLGVGYHELPRVKPPGYRLDFTGYEQAFYGPGELSKTLGGSFLPSQIGITRFAEFLAQHRRHIESWLWRERGKLPGGIIFPGENSPGPSVELLPVGLSVGQQNFNAPPGSELGEKLDYHSREAKLR